jgi:hypothetical protein
MNRAVKDRYKDYCKFYDNLKCPAARYPYSIQDYGRNDNNYFYFKKLSLKEFEENQAMLMLFK